MKGNQKTTKTWDQRPTIGVIVDSMGSGYQTALWSEIKNAAEEHDLNLLCFLGREIESPIGYHQTANAIYNLISPNSIDGLILLTGTISYFIDPDTLVVYLKKFQTLPIVSIAVEIDQTPSILLDNAQGIRDLTTHLIQTHNYRQIGFVRMVEGHTEGDIRFEAYKETLREHGIPYNPDLVVPGKYYDQPEAAVSLLYDERKVTPEAIIVVDDYMALPILDQLSARGIVIPRDVAIVGFDDDEETRYSNPPLTTVQQPLREQAFQAIDMILASLQGNTVPLKVNLSPHLILRESCGCYHRDIIQAAAPATIKEQPEGNLSTFQDLILSNILDSSEIQEVELVKKVLDAFTTTLETKQTEFFLRTLTQALQQSGDQNILAWQSVISTLRRHVLNILQDTPQLAIAENLIQQARVMLADFAQKNQASRRLNAQQQHLVFLSLSQAINTATDYNVLINIIASQLPNLGIPECSISLYDQGNPGADSFSLILHQTHSGSAQLPSEGLTYPSSHLLPDGLLPEDRRFTKMIEPLYFQEEHFGYATFEAEALDETIYDVLAEQISSGLKGVELIQQSTRRNIQLQTTIEVSHAISEILDPNELSQKVVDLIKERFELYYAGLFTVDANGEFAVLRTGTGEAGQKMVADGWKLKIGGSSMIGRCISSAQADIQLDIDKAPVHLRNPYLPETKSEMALPLFSRGVVLGALTIQSEKAMAFSQDDVEVLQTMANQVATSIANAHLFEQTQTALLDTETLLNVSRAASASEQFEPYIQQVLDLTLKSTGIEYGLISIINPQTDQLEIASHQIPELFLKILQTNGLEGTLCDMVLQRRFPIIVCDLANDSPIDATGLINLGFNSYQGVPLETKGKIFGTLCTFSESILQPEDTRVALLQAIGQLVSVAIENTRLIEQTQDALADTEQQSQRLAALNTLSEKLSQAKTLGDIYQIGATVIPQIVSADHTTFARLKEDGKHAELVTVSEEEDVISSVTIIPIEGTSIDVAIKTKNPIIVTDATQSHLDQDERFSGLGLRSFLVVPLTVSNEAIGALRFGSKAVNNFSERDRDLAMQLASSMGNAIENYNLLQQTQKTLFELENTQRRYQLQAWSIYNQSRVSVGYTQRNNSLEPIGKQKIPEAEKAIQEQVPVVSEDGENIKLTIPIMLRDQPIGAIGLETTQEKRQWTPEEIALVQEITEQFALAAESLRLLDETQRRAARERLVSEITTKIRASNDPQTMIQTAAQELREALQAKRTQILIQKNETPLTRGDE